MLTFNSVKKLINKITEKMIIIYVRSESITTFIEAIK